jgi:hypothetical protein
MTTLVLSIGIAVMFLTVWGVIMVVAYLLGREPAVAATAVSVDWVASTPAAVEPVQLT